MMLDAELKDGDAVPVSFVVVVLFVTIVLTLMIIQPPLRRAARLRPGDALRYQ